MFPLNDPVNPSAPNRPAATVAILMVDSNVQLLEFAARLLQKVNCQVTTAFTPQEGLRILSQRREQFAVIITTLRFNYGSHSLAYLSPLYAARAGAAVIVISGDHPDVQERHWLAERKIPFLPKPFAFPQLLALLDQVTAP